MLFNQLGLSAELLRAIDEKGYLEATPIQQQSIPIILEGHDILAGAQTGTGKTAQGSAQAGCSKVTSLANGKAEVSADTDPPQQSSETASTKSFNFTAIPPGCTVVVP